MLEPLFTTPEQAPVRLPVRKRPQSRKPVPGPSASRTFEFVTSDSAGKPPAEARKFIRSYVMRGKNKKRTNDRLRAGASWINHEAASFREGQLCEPEREPSETLVLSSSLTRDTVALAPYLPHPFRPPPDLTLFNFATPLDGQSRYLIYRFFTSIKETMYPAEWCFEFDRTKVCWFRWLLHDAAYLHSVLFMVSAFQDLMDLRMAGTGRHETWDLNFSPHTQYRLRKTIQLLQERIQDHEQQLSDTTTAIIMTLAMMADASGDVEACQMHVAGLKKLVRMRGGLQGFEDNRQMQIKICRVDLGWSIKNGTQPDFYDGAISWEPFLDKVIQNNPPYPDQPTSTVVQNSMATWGFKLRNVFSDLRDFSRMANTLIPRSHQKLQPELFQEMTLSFQYRLLLLDYSVDEDPVKEAIRLGLLAYETTIFLQIPGVKLDSPLFGDRLRAAIESVIVSSPGVAELKLWLLFVGAIIVFDFKEPWLLESIRELTREQTWEVVRQRMKAVMWIDIVHDGPGQQAFEAVQQNRPPLKPLTSGKSTGSRPLPFTGPTAWIPSILYRH
ncbi:Fc.00g095890.m01.CDS01 [Cosmosporella sp. VM-42]